MITREKIEELRQKMIHHDVVNDQAVVTITARELYDLIGAAESYLILRDSWREEDRKKL